MAWGTTSNPEKGTPPSSTIRPRLKFRVRAIEDLAVKLFQEGKDPLTVRSLAHHFGKDERKAKKKIHELVKKGILFTLDDERQSPQWWFPTIIQTEVYKWHSEQKAKKGQRGTLDPPEINGHKIPLDKQTEEERYQSAYRISGDKLLPLLAGQPLQIHNLHFKTNYHPSYYDSLQIAPTVKKVKVVEYAIYDTTVTFTFYPVGTVIISINNSKTPFNFETEADHTRLFCYLGAVSFQLAKILFDPRGRKTPDIMEWFWTYAEANKHIPVDHSWHLHAFNLQVKHLDFALKVHIKDMGKETV